MKPLATYRLEVAVMPDRRLPPEEPDAPPEVTIRRAVKQLWRAYRVKLIEVRPAPAAGAAEVAETPTRTTNGNPGGGE